MIERAVKRNPRNPDFEGLQVFMSNLFDSTGGIVTTEFDKYMAEVKKSEAIVMKQERMWSEEQASRDKRAADPKKGKGGGKGAEAPSGA